MHWTTLVASDKFFQRIIQKEIYYLNPMVGKLKITLHHTNVILVVLFCDNLTIVKLKINLHHIIVIFTVQ